MVGTTIGKYHVLDRIGRGGMGTVYRAVDEILHREVAIKVLNSELNDPEVAKRFRAEAVTVARLSHPGIATIYELFQHDGQWMMVMEFVRGETLEHLVERMGALSPQRAAELCMQALTALAHAHSMGVIHRDLKPANLMITESGAVKIMDFGIARVSGSEHLTSAGFMMGTPAYMAPEQVLGQEIDARADLYALGVVFYRLTTAKLPFKGDTPFAMAQSQVNDPPTPLGMLRPDLPPWADQVAQRALSKQPADRFQSAVEFYEAFSRCLAGLPMTAVYNPSGPTELLHTPSRPMPTAAIPQTPSRPLGQPSGQLPIPGQTLPPAYGGEMASRVTASGRTPQPTGPIAAPTPTATSGSMPVAPVEPAAPVAPTPTVPPPPKAATPKAAKPAKPAGPKKTNDIAIVALAGVAILLLAVFAFLWIRSHRPQPVTQTAEATPTPTATATPEPTVTVPPPDVPLTAGTPSPTPAGATAAPIATVPPPAATPTTTVPPRPADTTGARGATPTTSPSPTSTPGRSDARGATPRPTPTPSASAAPTPTTPPIETPDARGRAAAATTPTPTPEEHLAFQDIKLLSVNGKKATDQDVLMAFSGGQIVLTSKSGGSAIQTLPYKTIAHATYVHAKDPKWDSTLPAPAEKLDLPGLIHTSQHWLALQTHQMYLILRLHDDNWERIVQAVETRAGLKVDRASDK